MFLVNLKDKLKSQCVALLGLICLKVIASLTSKLSKERFSYTNCLSMDLVGKDSGNCSKHLFHSWVSIQFYAEKNLVFHINPDSYPCAGGLVPVHVRGGGRGVRRDRGSTV